jgi:hypothetical protein
MMMALLQVTLGHTLKPFDLWVPMFLLIIVPSLSCIQTYCYDFEQCICDKPVLAFGTEQITIVNSRCLSPTFPKVSQFDELSKECLARGIVLESLRAKFIK